jgi:hypothetical protein
MRKFNLPLVAANLSVDTALKTAIDAKRSGVVLKTKSGGLRLVHYEDLVGASKKKIDSGHGPHQEGRARVRCGQIRRIENRL